VSARAASIVLCGALSLLCARAFAQPEPATVRLHVPDCHGVEGEQVRSLVALELAPRLRMGARKAGAEIVGKVTCDPRRVRIEIHDPQQALPLRLELDLAAAPPQARTRLLALSIAELIATGRLERAWLRPQAPGEDAAAMKAAADQAAERAAAEKAAAERAAAEKAAEEEAAEEEAAAESAVGRSRPAWTVWAAPGLSRMGEPGVTLYGLEGGAGYALGPALLLAQLQARWGAADALAADVAVQAYSMSFALSPHLSLGAFDFALAPGARLGYARLSGTAAQPDLQGASLSGAWFGPCVQAGLQLRVTSSAAVRAGFEFGYVTQSVRGLDHASRRLLELDGVWLSASVGAALLLP
jgi:hypothetical protein